MSDRDVALAALSAICNSNVTSVQCQGSHGQSAGLTVQGFLGAAMGRPMLMGSGGGGLIIDEEKFFDPKFDYDFTDLHDTETYYRGGEVYERPCGWKRYALKVLDEYPGGNAWLGERGYNSGTQSKAGEWPVSYHGTSKKGAQGIIVAHYEVGPGQYYGRGVYSTPYMADALEYTKNFSKNGKNYQVVMQNRVNPKYREKHNNGKYWLVPIPDGLSDDEEQEIVEKAIRPYAILVKKL